MEIAPLSALWAQAPAMVLVLARIGALLVSAPVLGGPYAPGSVKALLTVAIGMAVMPGLPAMPVPGLDLGFLLQLAREVLVGLSLGFVVNLIFHGVRAGGELINRHAGFSAAENFDPDADIGAGPMGDLFHMLLVLLFFAADLHLQLIATLVRSFAIIPLGTGGVGPAFGEVLAHGLGEMWMIAIALSFPVLTAVMLLTVAEGVITRAVPQINVLHISFAVKILVSVMVVYAALPAAVAFLGTILGLAQSIGETAIMAMR